MAKKKTGLVVIGKSSSVAGKTDPAAGAVILKGLNPFKGPARRVPMVKNRPHRPLDKNQLKVSRIKIAVENGLYCVDADSVAESMVERFLEMFLGCSVDCNGAHTPSASSRRKK